MDRQTDRQTAGGTDGRADRWVGDLDQTSAIYRNYYGTFRQRVRVIFMKPGVKDTRAHLKVGNMSE
jgi:hypothetical protein